MRYTAAALALTLAVACHHSTAPTDVDAIVGTWTLVRQPTDPPGSGERINLSILPVFPEGNTPGQAQLVGHGSWFGEAGPFGTSDATGAFTDGRATLTITYISDPQFGSVSRSAKLDCRLIDPMTMSGTLTLSDGTKASVTYRKFGID